VFFRVAFLDASATLIAEWEANASNAASAIELVNGLKWPDGAERMQIVDEEGRMIHWQAKPGEP
jgi:hypothetical protein